MLLTKFDVDSVLVVDNASHPGHGSIDGFVLLCQRPSFLFALNKEKGLNVVLIVLKYCLFKKF